MTFSGIPVTFALISVNPIDMFPVFKFPAMFMLLSTVKRFPPLSTAVILKVYIPFNRTDGSISPIFSLSAHSVPSEISLYSSVPAILYSSL